MQSPKLIMLIVGTLLIVATAMPHVSEEKWLASVDAGGSIDLARASALDVSHDEEEAPDDTLVRSKGDGSRQRAEASGSLMMGEMQKELNDIAGHGFHEVRTPLIAKREYRAATLASGMKVLVVYAPDKALRSAFAMSVGAGYYEDPEDFPGLAHLCRRVISEQQSSKYPHGDNWTDHQDEHHGFNFWKQSLETSVFGVIMDNLGLDKALDIFAHAIISPMFKSNKSSDLNESIDTVNRQINKVNDEHLRHKPFKDLHVERALDSIANPDSPVPKFHTGNLETLSKPGVMEALRTFHENNWCANRFQFVLMGNMSTDELLALVRKHFDRLPNADGDKCTPRPTYAEHTPYGKEWSQSLGRHLTLSTQGSPTMTLFFPMPDLRSNYKAKPHEYVVHVLRQFGTGSLKALLQREDLSHSLLVSSLITVAESALYVKFGLTPKGVNNQEKIQEYFFAFIRAIKEADASLVNATLYDLKQLRQAEFDYQKIEGVNNGLAVRHAERLAIYSPEDVLTGPILIDQVDLNLTRMVLDKLTPFNMNVVLLDPTFDETTAVYHDKYYEFGYMNTPLNSSLLARLNVSTSDGLAPPAGLPCVPRKLAVIEDGVGEYGPKQLVMQGPVEAWWNGMGQEPLPKALIYMKISYSQKIMDSVAAVVLGKLHAQLVGDILREPAAELHTCGVNFKVSPAKNYATPVTTGLEILFDGFDEHILELIKMVLPVIRAPNYTNDTFERVRRSVETDLGDVTTLASWELAEEALRVATMGSPYHSRSELIRTIKSSTRVSPASFMQYLQEMFDDAEIAILFTGNIDEDRSRKMTKSIEELLKITREQDTKVQGIGKLAVVNPTEEVELRLANPRPNDPQSVTWVTYQSGAPNISDRIHLRMIQEMIAAPIRDILGGEHQLGGIIWWKSLYQPMDSALASLGDVHIAVQGSRENPDTVEELIESLVQNLTARFEELNQTLGIFEKRKASMQSRAFNLVDNQIPSFADTVWGHIWNKDYCFETRNLEIEYLNSDEFKSPLPLVEAWKRIVAGGTDQRRKKVTVKLFGQAESKEEDSFLESPEQAARSANGIPEHLRARGEHGMDNLRGRGVHPRDSFSDSIEPAPRSVHASFEHFSGSGKNDRRSSEGLSRTRPSVKELASDSQVGIHSHDDHQPHETTEQTALLEAAKWSKLLVNRDRAGPHVLTFTDLATVREWREGDDVDEWPTDSFCPLPRCAKQMCTSSCSSTSTWTAPWIEVQCPANLTKSNDPSNCCACV